MHRAAASAAIVLQVPSLVGKDRGTSLLNMLSASSWMNHMTSNRHVSCQHVSRCFGKRTDTENNLKHFALLGCQVILFFLHSCPAIGKISVRSETQDWFHNSTRDWSLSLFLKCYRFRMLQFYSSDLRWI